MILAYLEVSVAAAVLVVLLLLRLMRPHLVRQRGDTMPDGPRVRRSAFALGVAGGSEEERMRRFLEALGIPSEPSDVKREATPPPIRSKQKSEPRDKPVSRAPSESSRPKQQRPQEKMPPLPQHSPATPSRPLEPPPLVRPARVPVPALHVRTLEPHERELPDEFQTMHSMAPARPPETAIIRGGAEFQREDTGSELWKEALRSPEALRSAVILQEILGPPRSLQSDKFPHSLRTL